MYSKTKRKKKKERKKVKKNFYIAHRSAHCSWRPTDIGDPNLGPSTSKAVAGILCSRLGLVCELPEEILLLPLLPV